MEPPGDLRQAPVPVVFLQIAENRNDRVLLLGLKLQSLGVVHQLGKEKPHSHLQNAALVGRVLQERIEQVLDQILNRRNVRHAKQKIARLVLPGQAARHKAAQRRLLLTEEGQGSRKEGRTHDKVYRNVPLPCRLNGLMRVLPQHQQLSLMKGNGLAVDHMVGLARTHVDHLHIVVGMLRKGDEARVRADRDELSLFQQLLSADHIPAAVHVKTAVNALSAIQDRSFFTRYDRDPVHDHRIHAFTPSLCLIVAHNPPLFKWRASPSACHPALRSARRVFSGKGYSGHEWKKQVVRDGMRSYKNVENVYNSCEPHSCTCSEKQI